MLYSNMLTPLSTYYYLNCRASQGLPRAEMATLQSFQTARCGMCTVHHTAEGLRVSFGACPFLPRSVHGVSQGPF